MYVAPMNLVRGMAGELFADVREHFQVSQPANERMPQAVIAKRTELTPFASLYITFTAKLAVTALFPCLNSSSRKRSTSDGVTVANYGDTWL